MRGMTLLRKSAPAFDAAILADSVFELSQAELAQRLVSSIDTAKVIVLRSSPVLSDHSLLLSCLDFAAQLTKPIVPSELLQALLNVRSPRASLPKNEAAKSDATVDLKLRVLLAEDNLVNQKLALRMLERMGCSVVLAENGKDAVAVFESDRNLDVVLMDIQMPMLDGLDTTRQLRKINFTKPIIALSASAYKEDIEKSLEAGMNGHLHKPFTEAEIFKVISENCKGKLPVI